MRKLLVSLLILPLFIFASVTIADTIDQNQPSDITYMAGFGQLDLAQSFIQSHGNISGAGIFLKPSAGETGNVNITLLGCPSERGWISDGHRQRHRNGGRMGGCLLERGGNDDDDDLLPRLHRRLLAGHHG